MPDQSVKELFVTSEGGNFVKIGMSHRTEHKRKISAGREPVREVSVRKAGVIGSTMDSNKL